MTREGFPDGHGGLELVLTKGQDLGNREDLENK